MLRRGRGNPRAFASVWRETGSLWGATDEAEATVIREWVELLAEIPMGYGRVGSAPDVLGYDDLDISPRFTR